MPQVKLAARFTKDTQPYNGLTDDNHVADLIDQPHDRRYALVSYDVLRIADEIEDGTKVPTIKWVQIEPLDGDAAARAKADMRALYKRRTGNEPSPDRVPEPTLLDELPDDDGKADDDEGPVSERTPDVWLDDK